MTPTAAERPPLHYPDCGLDDVYLLNGYERHETPCGEGVSVKDVDGLRAAIAASVVARGAPLRGKEVRFLRKQMDLTQAELGRLLGLDAQSVARWEKDETRITGPSDRLLRLLYLGRTAGAVRPEKVLRALDAADAPARRRQVFRAASAGWKAAA